jgi:hypothetical protein
VLKSVELEDLDVPRGHQPLGPVHITVLDPERGRAERAAAADGLPRADLDDVRVPVEEDTGEARLADARAARDEQADGAQRRAGRGRGPERGAERERRDHERVRGRVRVRAGRRVFRARAVRVGQGEDGRRCGREEDDEAGLPSVESSESDVLSACDAGADTAARRARSRSRSRASERPRIMPMLVFTASSMGVIVCEVVSGKH